MAIERHLEGRDFESRNHDHIMFGRADSAHFDIFYNFPKSKMPPGMIYVWGNFDSENLTKLWVRGYRFVPSSRHPEYCAHQFGLEDPRYIYKKRQVLMEISEDIFNRLKQQKLDARNQTFKNQERMNNNKGHNMLGQLGSFASF